MFSRIRPLCVACVTACLVLAPCANAFAREGAAGGDSETTAALETAAMQDTSARGLLQSLGQVRFDAPPDAPFAAVPSTYAMQQRGRQSVATTTESKMLLGIVAGSMIVAGMALMAYGATSTCKGSEGTSTSGCDKKAVIGAMSFSGGAAMLVLWALSR